MRKMTSLTIWDDAVGKRISITYSEIEDGRIVTDNRRVDRVLEDSTAIQTATAMQAIAQAMIEEA